MVRNEPDSNNHRDKYRNTHNTKDYSLGRHGREQ